MKKINKIKVLGVIFLMIGIVTCLCFLMNHQNKLVTHKIKNYQSNDDELLTLVNFENTIPEDWKVDLVRLNNNQLVDRRIYKDLTAMLKVAKSEGLNLLICSSYRTNEKQEQLYQNKVNNYLKQGVDEKSSFEDNINNLKNIFR